MNSSRKRPVNCNVDSVQKFEQFYPHLKEIFLTRCLDLACQDKDFFDKVFFNELFVEVK